MLYSEMSRLSEKVDVISRSVNFMETEVRGVTNRMSDVERKTQIKQHLNQKTEQTIMKLLKKLQKDVDIMKQDIRFIKNCWIDSAQPYDDDDEEDNNIT